MLKQQDAVGLTLFDDQIRNNKNHISKVETVDGKILDIKLRFNN